MAPRITSNDGSQNLPLLLPLLSAGASTFDGFLPRTGDHSMKLPALCRPEAFQLFAQTLPQLKSTSGLQDAAVAIALHALDDVDPTKVERRLQELADKVLSRVSSRRPEALIAHLHAVLFEDERFCGEASNYYSPLNSYLPAVLESCRGIPITLALVYKLVGERIGLTIDGLNAPGHFLVRVRDSRGWLIIDPYHGGAVLTPTEAFELMERTLGHRIDRLPCYLEAATHEQWLARMLANLQQIFSHGRCSCDLAAMTELQALLESLEQ